MSELSHTVIGHILAAHTAGDIPPTEPLVPYKNIGELLEQQVDRFEQKAFLIFYDDAGHRREYSYREFYEEVCKTANFLHASGIVPGSHEDWCDEHQVQETMCTRCDPSLIPAFKASGDWDEMHGLPKSQCLKCDPTLKIVRPPKA